MIIAEYDINNLEMKKSIEILQTWNHRNIMLSSHPYYRPRRYQDVNELENIGNVEYERETSRAVYRNL